MEKSKTSYRKWRMEKNLKNVVEFRTSRKKFISIFFYLVLVITLQSCKTYRFSAGKKEIPIHDFNINFAPPAPIYSKIKYWAEHPEKKITHAILPKNYTDSLYNYNSKIDVFFVHPTLYFKGENWNANVDNEKLNNKIKASSIKHQANVFSGIANIYAPHYRQMHIHAYSDLKNGYKAYDLAYSDVKNAFLYYWKNYNKSKKFIIASHSQGTNHSERLLKEIILQNDSMKDLLIISYLVGMPISPFNEDHPPCSTHNQLNCFLSWQTFAEGYLPDNWVKNDSTSCVNPISWTTDNNLSRKQNHLGILFRNHKIQYPNSITAYNHNSVVWIKKIQIPFEFFYRRKNYHFADYNLFWLNIRHNLRSRLKENGYN